MASEIRVNKIENRSGLGTVTFADTGVDLAGIVTATTFSGSGASLTNVPDSALSAVTASKLSGALPAISAASLTNVPAANVVGVHTSLTVTNATTTGTAVVGGGVTISESGIEASGIGITVANINGTQIGGRRNLVINGAILVAQRGTSSVSQGYTTVDRFKTENQGVDEGPTRAQVDVASGTTPYTLGFRKAYKITNGNNTSGAEAGDYHEIIYKTEAQDLANSGWNYTSSSSYITLSFWVKASVAQNYYFRFQTKDGTSYNYPMETGSLSANTWTKITKTIPGASNLQIDNDNGEGPKIAWSLFKGTNFTASSVTLNQWAAYADATQTPDQTTTWWTTNDATFEITGVQLEVGSQATAFEHRSFGEELRLCQRYFFNVTGNNQQRTNIPAFANSTSTVRCMVSFPTPMRATPTFSGSATDIVFDSADDSSVFLCSALSQGGSMTNSNPHGMLIEATPGGMTAGQSGVLEFRANSGELNFSAEL